jgi:hypothetical protein
MSALRGRHLVGAPWPYEERWIKFRPIKRWEKKLQCVEENQ